MPHTRCGVGKDSAKAHKLVEGLGEIPHYSEGTQMSSDRMPQANRLPGTRRFARFPISLRVTGRAGQSSKKPIQGVVRSIGAGGLMVEFPVQMVAGRAMGLVLQRRHGPLTVKGRVVWASPARRMVRHGFAFLEPQWPGFAMDLFLDENR
jgi:hypothetical protein